MRIILGLFSIVLLIVGFQNCVGPVPVKFVEQQKSLLSSSMTEGPGVYDGKPENGYYCRIYDNMSCQSQVNNLQGLVKVDNSGIHLTVDNCASTSFTFLPTADVAVSFTSLIPEYIGASRGIFKKCEVGAGNIPLPPTEVTDAYCTSEDGNTALVINKNIQNKIFDFKLVFRDGAILRSATGNSITKNLNSNISSYTSQTEAFSLTISQANTQTLQAQLKAVVDQKSWSKNLNCRQASAESTVIIKNDMELSPTWIDTSQLVGYWKLNEPSAVEGTTVVDSSPFGSSGVLLTGNDGLNKSDLTVDGGAISFDGINDGIEILRPLDGHLEFDTRSFSYMAWIRKNSVAGAWDMPFAHGGYNARSPGYVIECNSSLGNCRACIGDGLGTVNCSTFGGNGIFFSGNWVLLTAVADRSMQQLRTYVNGALISTVNISLIGSVSSTANKIGIGNDGLGQFQFTGSIDDVSIWNRTLTENEILEIFQRMRPKFY